VRRQWVLALTFRPQAQSSPYAYAAGEPEARRGVATARRVAAVFGAQGGWCGVVTACAGAQGPSACCSLVSKRVPAHVPSKCHRVLYAAIPGAVREKGGKPSEQNTAFPRGRQC